MQNVFNKVKSELESIVLKESVVDLSTPWTTKGVEIFLDLDGDIRVNWYYSSSINKKDFDRQIAINDKGEVYFWNPAINKWVYWGLKKKSVQKILELSLEVIRGNIKEAEEAANKLYKYLNYLYHHY